MISSRKINKRTIGTCTCKAADAEVSNAADAEESTEVFPKELPKSFDFVRERQLYAWWEANGFFSTEAAQMGQGAGENEAVEMDAFVMSMPPPNVTGALHMGHAMFLTMEDLMVRFWRMRGRPTLWVPGTDHAGIATQLVVEKMLLKEEGVRRADLGREEFLRRVWEWKKLYGGTIAMQIRRMGASCDWSRERFTLDSQLSSAVAEAFFRLHEKGLIYRGSYMVNWSPNLQTAVSDLEVEYSEESGKLYFFKYPLADGSSSSSSSCSKEDFLPIATTRPETILGDTAVAVHPEDERYAKFVGKTVVVPVGQRREIPVIADEYVEREFGTGALKITPGHDVNDYALGQRHNLPLINIMNKNATLNENAGPYCGLDRSDARKKVWEDLEALGLAIKVESHTQRVPRSQRGGEVIEPLVSKQWFVRMQPLAQPALQAVQEKRLRILPERFEKTYNFWLENIKDWCISRQLWWGHRIPVWYVGSPSAAAAGDEEEYVVARTEEEAYGIARQKYGEDISLNQDPDVLDTWFSSGLWPFSTLGWPDTEAKDLQKFYPTSVLETGHDILFFWVARMAMLGIEFTGQPPFHTVYLHGLVRDAQGRKMSKSLGNVIDPLETIDEYGTDALRFTLATGTTPGQDVNVSMERMAANKAFTNKLWNAGKFILQNLPSQSDAASWNDLAAWKCSSADTLAGLPLAERWVLSRLHEVVDSVTLGFEKFEFGTAGKELYDFFWSDFADWYIESAKTRLYQTEDEQQQLMARRVLVYVFDSVLRLLHPFMPFVTEQVWQALPHTGPALIVASWPSQSLPRDSEAVADFEALQALVRSIRNARAEYSVEPARRIEAVVVAGQRQQNIVKEEAAVLIALTRLDATKLNVVSSAPEGVTEQAAHLVVGEGLEAYLPLSGMVDLVKEVERLSKQANKLMAELQGLQKRLSMASFIEKAPVPVVQAAQQQQAEATEKLSLLEKRLKQLRGSAAATVPSRG